MNARGKEKSRIVDEIGREEPIPARLTASRHAAMFGAMTNRVSRSADFACWWRAHSLAAARWRGW